MDSARTAVFASRCRQVPILYPSKLLLAISLLVIFARTGMCSRAQAIFILPEGASLGSFTRLKVKPEVSGEDISVIHNGSNPVPEALIRKISYPPDPCKIARDHLSFSTRRLCINEQPTLSLKSHGPGFSWKIGRSHHKRIESDADRASVRGENQRHG